MKDDTLRLQDLYTALDWSQADQALQQWEHQSPTEYSAQQWKEGFRYSLLEQALWGKDEAKDFAVQMLFRAGVWKDLVRYVSKHRSVIDGNVEPLQSIEDDGDPSRGAGAGEP